MSKSLKDRMDRYEASYNFMIPPRTYTIVRIDGKNFSKYTKQFNKPFDDDLSDVMDIATVNTCQEFNPKFAYTQSDEVSFLFTDFDTIETEMMFKGKVQKLCSLIASKFTAEFNNTMLMRKASQSEDASDFLCDILEGNVLPITACFDARVFIIPDFREVSNYFVWRQQDATRNSVSMAASSYYSHKQLTGVSGSDKQDLLMDKGINWNNYKTKYKRGIVINRKEISVPTLTTNSIENIMRKKWVLDNDTPIFTQDKEFLFNMIPIIGQ
jgi:tRNA(His) 5'-end guanylyltransferase